MIMGSFPLILVAFEKYMHVFKEYVRQGRDSIDIYAPESTILLTK